MGIAVVVFSPEHHQSITALSTQSLRNIIIYLNIIRATAMVLIRKFMKGTREQIIIMIETENVISFLYRLFIYYITTYYIIGSYLTNIKIHDCIKFQVFLK